VLGSRGPGRSVCSLESGLQGSAGMESLFLMGVVAHLEIFLKPDCLFEGTVGMARDRRDMY
jgi:hypothetical protein